MGTLTEEEEYAAFEKRVERTIYVENLSPHVTVAVLNAAFGQFGDVKSIHFIPNYFAPTDSPLSALVEMDNAKLVHDVVDQSRSLPLMILGMPRPVRLLPARYEMFADRPRIPNQKIECRWLDQHEPDFMVAKKMKNLIMKHIAETSFVVERQRSSEEKLAAEQTEKLKGHYQKLEMIESLIESPLFRDLGRCYGVNSPNT